MEKGTKLIAKQDHYELGATAGEKLLTKGKEYEVCEKGLTKDTFYVVADNGQKICFGKFIFDLFPTPTFKVGDKVYWNELEGEVTANKKDSTSDSFPVEVLFSNGMTQFFTLDGCSVIGCPRVLTFKPHTLDFSRPKWEPKEGELVLAWDNGWKNTGVFGVFLEMTGPRYLLQLNNEQKEPYDNCAPFTGELPQHLQEVKS